MDDPLKSCKDARPEGSECLDRGAIRLIALILVSTATAVAQSAPASISTIQQPSLGHPAFDASGNTYYLSGQPTAGAAQTQSGGGTCSIPAWLAVRFRRALSRCGGDQSRPFRQSDLGYAARWPEHRQWNRTRHRYQWKCRAHWLHERSVSHHAWRGHRVQHQRHGLCRQGHRRWQQVCLFHLPAGVRGRFFCRRGGCSGQCLHRGQDIRGPCFRPEVERGRLYHQLQRHSRRQRCGRRDSHYWSTAAGNAFVAGQTTSPDFPVTAGAFQQQLKGTQNNFLVRLDPSGNVLTSTYFGGSGSDNPSSIALDGAGNIDLAGSTSSLDFPTTKGVMQPSAIVPPWNSFAPAGFVAQFGPDGISLKWASYVMSFERLPADANFDVGVSALAVSPAGDIYIGGLTGPGFPVTPSAPVICFQGSTNRTNGFLAHLNPNGALIDATYLGNSAGSDVISVGGLLRLPGGSVLVAGDESGAGVVSKVQFGSGGWIAPACLSTNVLNAATQVGSGGVAPGELVTLTGFGIGPDIGVTYQADARGNVPTQLAGVQVLFDGTPVPILYAQSQQINTIAPAGLTVNGTTHVMVTYNNQQFGPAVAKTTFGSPGIFRLQIGQSAQAVAINQDGTLNGPMNPAPRGSVVALWGTGYGLTSPPCPIGGLNLSNAAPLSPGTSAFMSSLTGAKPAPVQYAGSAPSLVCGVEQINFQVPVDATPGTFSFLLWIQLVDGNTTTSYYPQTDATITVK